MSFASFYRYISGSWSRGLAVAAAIAACPAASMGQVQQAYHHHGSPVAGGGVNNANYTQGPSELMTAYGDPVVIPAGFHGPAHPGAMPGGYAAGCDPYGGGGYPDPSLDLYGMPNYAADQSGPHYFDFSAEALYWARVDTAEPDLAFATQGLGGDVVLSTADLSFDEEAGMRLVGRYDIGPVSMIEIGYSGLYEWGDRAEFQSGGFDLFSPFSDFGIDPAGGAGLTETDLADFASLDYGSELHNGEISYRHYWVGWSPRVTGSWLAGARYTRLSEDFFYATGTQTGSHLSQIRTENDLVGFQAGGDMWITVRQGIRIGGQGKAGLYNNRAEQSTHLTAEINGVNTVDRLEIAKGDRLAFLTEGNVSVVADITPSFSFRAGYDVLFINTVALAPNNFNNDNEAFFGAGPRNAILIEESSVLYHGANLGFEYVW